MFAISSKRVLPFLVDVPVRGTTRRPLRATIDEYSQRLLEFLEMRITSRRRDGPS